MESEIQKPLQKLANPSEANCKCLRGILGASRVNPCQNTRILTTQSSEASERRGELLGNKFTRKVFPLGGTTMRRLLLTTGVALLMAIPSLSAQDSGKHVFNHGEVGIYGDLFRIAPSGAPATNYLGLGARVGFNVGTHAALEAEMNYNFEQNYTKVSVGGSNNGGSTSGSGGVSSNTYTARVRPITGLFGPKFQFGSSGPFRAFVEGKGGFINFTTNCNAPAGSGSCFASSLSTFGGSSTHFAAFPGGGIEFFAGPIGLRIDAGDELWVDNGAHNNLRVTFSPTIRF